MSDDALVVTLTLKQLREAVADAVRDALPPAPRPQLVPAARDEWLSVAKGAKRYGVGRVLWLRLITTGKMRATLRPSRGGHDGWFVRASDADKAFAPNN